MRLADRQIETVRRMPCHGFGTRRMAACLVAFALACATTARAAHIVEFQMQSTKLVQLVEHRVLEEEVCALSSFSLPGQNGQFVLDHLGFPGPVQVQRAGQQIQFVVPVQVYTKTEACIHDPNCAANDYTPNSPLSLTLVLDLNAMIDEDGKLNLCVEFNSLKLGGQTININSLDAGLADSLGGLLSPKCSKVDVMKSLKKLLKSDRTIKQVGVSANQDLSRIAVRIELDDPASPGAAPASSWSDFNAGQIFPSASGMEWSLFMNQTLLKQALAARFATSIEAQEDIEILAGPSTSYTGLGSAGGRVQLTMELEYDAGCPFNNVGIDPAIVTLDLFANNSKPNVIQSHGSLYTDVVDADVVACAFSFGPFGIIGLPVFAAIAENAGPGEDDYPDECNQINDEEFACEQPVTLPVIRLSKFGSASWATNATLTLNKLHGHEGGISMGGPCTVDLGLPNPPKDLLAVTNGSFGFGVQGGCSSLHMGWSGGFSMSGEGRLCSIYIIDDPKGVYGVNTNWTNHALGNWWIGDFRSVELTFPKFGSDYAGYVANPYPCRVVIRSSAGARCVEIPGPDPASINEAAAAAELALAKANCLKPFWFSLKYMEMLWLVDPPPYDMPVYVRFDDPFVYTQRVTSQVLDVRATVADPVSTEGLENGQARFGAVKMNLVANIAVNVGAAAAAPPPVSAPVAFAGKSLAAARPVFETNQPMMLTIEHPVTLDLTGLLGDGSVSELLPATPISQTIVVPEDQLPEGVAEMSFILDIPVDRIALQAQVEPVELEYAPQPMEQACGDGACGVGGAGMVPFMALGWFSMRGRRRRRR